MVPVLFLAALADADAALGRVGEAAVVVGELEVRLDLGRVVVRAEPEVLAGQVGVDHLVRVHLVVGVPDRLELAEGADQSGAEHLGQERRLRLAVAVLAGDRAAVADDQVARLVEELAEVLDALDGLQVEVDPGVDAALAEVAVERAVVAVLLEQLAEVAEVGADADRGGRRNPPSPPRRPSRRGCGRSRPGPTRGPSTGALPRPRRRTASSTAALCIAFSRSISSLGLVVGLVLALAAELDQQPAAARRAAA